MSAGATITLEHLPPKATTLPPVPVDILRATLREVLAERRTRTDEILTLAEAITYTKHESESAFYRWCARFRVTAFQPGRFARAQLDRGLGAEAEKKRQPKPAPRRQAVAA